MGLAVQEDAQKSQKLLYLVTLIPNLSMEKLLVGSKKGSKIIPDMLQMLFGYRHYVNRKCPTSFVDGLKIRISRTIPVVFTFRAL